MQKQILDATGGVVSTVWYEPDVDKGVINTKQMVGPYLRQNERCRHDSVQAGTFRLTGSIPFNLLVYLLKERGLSFHQFQTLGKKEKGRIFKQILDDREYYKLRTSEKTREASKGLIIR